MTLLQTYPVIQLKRGTAADLAELNPTPAEGEIILELDTGRFKIGTGLLPWNSLTYANNSAGSGAAISIPDVIGLQAALSGKQPAGVYVLDSDPRLSDARNPLEHAHTIADVISLQTALDGKQPAGNYVFLVNPPASASAPGAVGAVAYDASFFYVCVAPDTWVRAALETWA